MQIPGHINNEQELEEYLSRPAKDLEDFMTMLEGDIIILGAAGKMGVSLSQLAMRAIKHAGIKKKVIAVSRFSDPAAREAIEMAGAETIECDLLNRLEVNQLPKIPNVIYMAGRKFGTQQDQELSWAINVLAPDYEADHFRKSRIVVFSTGCVYPLVSPEIGSCTEDTAPEPVGEYAQSCLGRERVFSYYAKTFETKICQFRLNYAIDLRYGVLYDIGVKVFNSQPIDLSVSNFNCIWQGDANRIALLSLDHCSTPPEVLNVTGAESLSVKETAEKFAAYFNKRIEFTHEKPDQGMYLSEVSKSISLFGNPVVPVSRMIEWQAGWIERGGRSLGKPTHFEVTSGKF